MRALVLCIFIVLLWACGALRAEERWVVVGEAGRRLSSADGVGWGNDRSWGAGQGDLRAVVYGNGLFLAVGGTAAEGRILASREGVEWREVFRGAGRIDALVFGKGRFVAVQGARLLWSEDGGHFSPGEAIPGAGHRVRAIACGDTEAGYRFMVAGEREGDLGWRGLTTDGARWEQLDLLPEPPRALAYGAGHFVEVSGTVRRTHDGVSWEEAMPRQVREDPPRALFWDGRRFYTEGAAAWRSSDGLLWQRETPALPAGLLWLQAGRGGLCFPPAGPAAFSSDLRVWRPLRIAVGGRILAVAYRGDE